MPIDLLIGTDGPDTLALAGAGTQSTGPLTAAGPCATVKWMCSLVPMAASLRLMPISPWPGSSRCTVNDPSISFVTANAVQVHGGMGVTGDLPLERFYKEARLGRIWDGPDETHVATVARLLLKPYRDAAAKAVATTG